MRADAYTKLVLTVIAICLIWLSVISCVGPVQLDSTSLNVNLATPVQAQSNPQNTEVTRYALAWNKDTNVGNVRLQFPNGKTYDAKIASAADLAGWAAVLNQKPVYVDSKGWIFTGAKSPAE